MSNSDYRVVTEPKEPWWKSVKDTKFTGNPMPIFSESERRQWLDDREQRMYK